MTMEEIIQEVNIQKKFQSFGNTKQFIKDLEEFLKKYSLVEKFWLSADEETLTVDFYGGTRKVVNIGRDSHHQIIVDLIRAGVI